MTTSEPGTPGAPVTRTLPTYPPGRGPSSGVAGKDSTVAPAKPEAKPETKPDAKPDVKPAARPEAKSAAPAAAAATSGVRPMPAKASGPDTPAPGVRPGVRPGAKPAPARSGSKPRARRVRLSVQRIDPWSAMKVSFLLSFAAALVGVVMVAVLWMVLSGMSVFSDIDGVIRSLQPSTVDNPFSIMEFVAFPRVVSLAAVIGVVNVVLLTALGTLMAYIYNLSAALVGGLQLTLSDD